MCVDLCTVLCGREGVVLQLKLVGVVLAWFTRPSVRAGARTMEPRPQIASSQRINTQKENKSCSDSSYTKCKANWGKCAGSELGGGTGGWGDRDPCLWKQIKEQHRKGQVWGNRKSDARKWSTSAAGPPASVLKVKSDQREYGVSAQVSNETCTFDRYVSFSLLPHEQVAHTDTATRVFVFIKSPF